MKQNKLSNLFDFLPKSKIKAGNGLEEGKYPFYTSSENQAKYLDEFQHEPGCLVFGTGGKASVHFTTSRFATSADCITIRPKPKAKIGANYVFQFFKGNMQVLESGFKGAGLRHISKKYISDIQISHPEELDDQKRIAHLLGKVEGLIARRKQHLQQLDDLLKSVFLEMFGDPVRNEKGWKLKRLIVVSEFENGDRSSNYPSGNDLVEDGILFISTKNISNNSLDFQTRSFITQEKFESLSRGKVRYGDILITLRGTLGRCCIFNSTEYPTAFINAQIMIIRPKAEINPVFLHGYLTSKQISGLLQKIGNGAAVPQLTATQLKELRIPIPDPDLQNQFAAIVEKVEGIKSRYQQSLADLEILYGALGQKAFKGELDLSRVPLPVKGPDIAEVEKSEIKEKQPMEPLFDLPAPEELAVLQTAEGRKSLLGEWLNAWLAQLGDTPFTAQAFEVSVISR